ncbi:MAG: hypothetical protein PHX10_09260 [Gallionellaceae bacterium]|nr:hypothetical protein [Gallionellaceae bacterium]
MAKRASGSPRRPRNPIAKAVRTPLFKMRVVEDKREREKQRLARQEKDRGPDKDKPEDG